MACAHVPGKILTVRGIPFSERHAAHSETLTVGDGRDPHGRIARQNGG